jgi:hypothetical protein
MQTAPLMKDIEDDNEISFSGQIYFTNTLIYQYVS